MQGGKGDDGRCAHYHQTWALIEPLERSRPRIRWAAWLAFVLLLPPAMTNALLGVVPLGFPNGTTGVKWQFIYVVNPLVAAIISATLVSLFWVGLERGKPYQKGRYYLPPTVLTFVVEVVVFYLTYSDRNTYPLMGLVTLTLLFISTFVALAALKPFVWHCSCGFYWNRLRLFFITMLVFFAYIAALSGWVLLFREVNGRENAAGEIALPFLLLMVAFAFKKILLAMTDSIPVEVAMLMSGLWIENLDDTFQTLIFPVAGSFDDLAVFFALWLRKFLENVAYLFFLTDTWFVFRVWIKDRLKRFFTCKGDAEPAVPVFEDLHPDDRGHSNEQPGYLRRQVQFFIYKIVSQVAASIFYVTVSPVLRFGPNKSYYPLAEASRAQSNDLEQIGYKDYRDSVAFAVINLFTALLVGGICYLFVRWRRPEVYKKVAHTYYNLLHYARFYFLAFAVLLCSQLLATGVLQYHTRIWFYADGQPSSS